uniref:Peptidase M13 N-terminal domain-containing protein n=1 Tax=Romanomermis culicivorax TaxID=13658 RepID=A0A915HWV6_ROMCU
MWRWFYSEVLPQLPDPYFMVHFKFLRALQNMKVPQLRWHSCIRQVNQHMLHATGALYVRQYFNPSAKQRVSVTLAGLHYLFINNRTVNKDEKEEERVGKR